jgi:hypothetical protein
MGGEHHGADTRPTADGITSSHYHHEEGTTVTTAAGSEPGRSHDPCGLHSAVLCISWQVSRHVMLATFCLSNSNHLLELI